MVRPMSLHQWLANWSGWVWPWLANHLWQATIISGIAFLAVSLLLRRAPGRARYTIWLFASAKFVFPSAILVVAINILGFDLTPLLPAQTETSEGTALIAQLASPITHLDAAVVQVTETAPGHNELFC